MKFTFTALVTGVITVIALNPSIAMAQTNQGDVALEVKPVMALISVLPGMVGGGAGGEFALSNQQTVFAEASFLQASMSDKLKEEALEDDELAVDRVEALIVKLGARHYFAPGNLDQWYAGGDLSLTQSRGDFDYGQSSYETRATEVLPALAGGYRWVWESGMLLRLGGSVGYSFVASKDIKSQKSSDDDQAGEEKIEEGVQDRVAMGIDLGVGFTF